MNEYIEKDKTNAPFLLAASFQGLISFLDCYISKGVIYWKFSPQDKAEQLLTQFRTKTEPHIPAKDLFDAIETFWKQVTKSRNGEMYRNGGTKTI